MENHEHIEALQDIRKMMKRSTRFLSLSGMSGVMAGIYALVGAAIAYKLIQNLNADYFIYMTAGGRSYDFASLEKEYLFRFALVAAGVLSASLITGFLFSKSKAKKTGQKLLDHNAVRLIVNLAIPLCTAGIFCFILYREQKIEMIGPAMLIFYGLSLLNASKYTLDEIRYLGISEIILGLVNGLWFLHYSLYFWAFGFGILHIVYGLIMWYKYDRQK
jgi:hypothetical protein